MKLLVRLRDGAIQELNPGLKPESPDINKEKEYSLVQITFAPKPEFQFQHPKPTTPDQSAIVYLPADKQNPFLLLNGKKVCFSDGYFLQSWPDGFFSFINTVNAVEQYLQRIGYKPQLEAALADLIDRS